MEKKITSHILVAAVIAILMNAVMYLSYAQHEIKNFTYSVIVYAIYFIGIILGTVLYKKQINKSLTFADAFGRSFKTAATVMIFHFFLFVLAVKFIFPYVQDLSIADASQTLKKMDFTPEQIKESLTRSRQYFIPLTLGTMVVGYGFIGLIASAVASVLTSGTNKQTNN